MTKDRVYKITIDGMPYEWKGQIITGEQIRKLANLDHDDHIYLSKKGENVIITNETKVDLELPGIEHFITKEDDKKNIIIVNGREKPWSEKFISFSQVVVLAFGSYDDNPNKVYTVTYDRGPKENPEGSMVRGDIVTVKNKMIFNVTATDKS